MVEGRGRMRKAAKERRKSVGGRGRRIRGTQ